MSRPYKKQYLFPPRPEYIIQSSTLDNYDNNEYYGQVKLNGSNCTLYITEDKFSQRNRHEGTIKNFKMNNQEILKLHTGDGEIVLVGEYMNKSKKDINGNTFNNKFVIFDILVYNNLYLVGTTTKERYEILLNLYNLKKYDDYLYQISENIFLVKSFEKNFLTLYSSIIEIDMLEGFVLKKKNAKLERCSRSRNNVGWQLKARRSTLNYKF